MWRGCARQKSHQLNAGPDNQTTFVCSLFGLTQVTKRRDLVCVRPSRREPGSLLRAWLRWAVNQTRPNQLSDRCLAHLHRRRRERFQWPKPGLPQIASSIWPKPEEQSRARAAWASPQSHRIHAATPVTTQHETEDRTDLNEPSSNCLAVGIHGRNLKTLESAVGINSNPPAKATVLDMHA